MVKRRTSSGFSLTELTVILVILGIVAAVASSRFASTTTYELVTTRDDIVAGLFYAQQLAIARGDVSTIQFVATSDAIAVRENGANLSTGESYPLNLPDDISLSPTITLSYDKLGRAYDNLGNNVATTFTLTDSSGGTATITVEATGYAH